MHCINHYDFTIFVWYMFIFCFIMSSFFYSFLINIQCEKKILILFVSHKIAVTNKTLWFDPSADMIYTSISQKNINFIWCWWINELSTNESISVYDNLKKIIFNIRYLSIQIVLFKESAVILYSSSETPGEENGDQLWVSDDV